MLGNVVFFWVFSGSRSWIFVQIGWYLMDILYGCIFVWPGLGLYVLVCGGGIFGTFFFGTNGLLNIFFFVISILSPAVPDAPATTFSKLLAWVLRCRFSICGYNSVGSGYGSLWVRDFHLSGLLDK